MRLSPGSVRWRVMALLAMALLLTLVPALASLHCDHDHEHATCLLCTVASQAAVAPAALAPSLLPPVAHAGPAPVELEAPRPGPRWTPAAPRAPPARSFRRLPLT